jgi:DNA-binding PadR family transcriptional regulator
MAKRTRDVEDLLPLTPRVLLILWGLDHGPQHPYRLLKTAEELGRGRVAIGPASLYEAIHALRAKGLIDETNPPDDEPATGPRRRYFRLTPFGRSVLHAEAERIGALAVDLRRSRIPRRP